MPSPWPTSTASRYRSRGEATGSRAGPSATTGSSSISRGCPPSASIRAARIATVGGGATLRALDAGAQAHGLATTAGIYRETGVAGLALGGGVGLLMRRYGLTCDNLLAAEVVTADGRVLEASETDHPDLFWALRGGGGNFGIVTRMDFRLHPLTHVLGGRLVYDFDDAFELGRFYRDVMADAPDDLQVYLSYSFEDEGKTASVVICHCGSAEAGEAVVERFRRFQRPVVETSPEELPADAANWDDSFPAGNCASGNRASWRRSRTTPCAVCQDAIAHMHLPNCHIDLEPMGGAIAEIAPDATAFADRDAATTLLIATGWTDPAESEARIAWARETFEPAQPYAKPSAYINYMDQGDEHRTEAAYGPNYGRLVESSESTTPKTSSGTMPTSAPDRRAAMVTTWATRPRMPDDAPPGVPAL